MTDNISQILSGEKTYAFIKGEITDVNEKQVRDYDITEMMVKDVTGSVMVSVFGKPNYYHVGDVVDCSHMLVKEFRGQKQLSPKKGKGDVSIVGKASDFDLGGNTGHANSQPANPSYQSGSNRESFSSSQGASGADLGPITSGLNQIAITIDRLIGSVDKMAMKITNKLSEVQVATLKQLQEFMAFRDTREEESEIPDDYFDAPEEE